MAGVALVGVCLGLPAAAAAQGAAGGGRLKLGKDDVIPLRLLESISSNESATGTVLRMEVTDNVLYGGRVIVRQGAPVRATVSRADKRWKRGQGGRVSVAVESVEMADGTSLPLHIDVRAEGGGMGGKAYLGLTALSVAALSPLGVAYSAWVHGEEVVVPAGTYVEGKIGKSVDLEAARFPLAEAGMGDHARNAEGEWQPPGSGARVVEPTGKSRLTARDGPREYVGTDALRVTTSTGAGAVYVGKELKGQAPLTLDLKPGYVPVRVVQEGYEDWVAYVAVAGDPLSVTVTMVAKK